MDEDEIRRRLDRLEQAVDNGRFVRKETYEADVRSQEKVGLADEQRRSAMNDRINELRDAVTWGQRQIIILMFSVIGAVIVATLVGSR